MKLFLAVRHDENGEFDVIGFKSYEDQIAFIEFNQDYSPFDTYLMSLNEAKAIFTGVYEYSGGAK